MLTDFSDSIKGEMKELDHSLGRTKGNETEGTQLYYLTGVIATCLKQFGSPDFQKMYNLNPTSLKSCLDILTSIRKAISNKSEEIRSEKKENTKRLHSLRSTRKEYEEEVTKIEAELKKAYLHKLQGLSKDPV